MIELLAGAITGAAMSDKGTAANWGSLVIALDPEHLGGRAQSLAAVQEMCTRVTAAHRLDGVSRIYLPGERGDAAYAKSKAEGAVAIRSALVTALHAMA